MVIHTPCTPFVDTESEGVDVLPPVALYIVELHAGSGENPVWKRRFGADGCLCTME